jgi:hypothetical protein
MCFLAHPLRCEPGDVSVRSFTGKEPQLGFHQAPPLPQDFQQLGESMT